ncbi:MAG: acyltransferase family protein [Terracidiphilus sp.]
MPANHRIKSVEAVKGIAIVLMVYGHVAQGAHHRGWWDSPAYYFQERFIYSFHMAAFFFASGLFVSGSIARYGGARFVLQRMRTVLWPYLFCVAGFVTDQWFGGKASAASGDFTHSILIPALSGEASWFLPTLFLCLLLSMLTDRLPAWVRFAGAVALNVFCPRTGVRILDSAAQYFVFTAAGEWLGKRIERVESLPRWAAFSGAVGLFLGVAAANLGAIHLPAIGILLGLAGTGGLFLLASALRNTAFVSGAVWCGAASLGIFELHPFFQGALRLVLARLLPSHPIVPTVLIPTAVAVVCSGLLWHFRKRLGIGFLFAFPWGEAREAPEDRERRNSIAATAASSE